MRREDVYDQGCRLAGGHVLHHLLRVASDADDHGPHLRRFRRSATGRLTVLKVTHHGSSTSSTPLFLSRFPPKIAVIQVGADNPYGHPTPEVLDRLQRTGARIFRNDEHGDVIVTIKDQRVDVAVTKPEAAF